MTGAVRLAAVRASARSGLRDRLYREPRAHRE